MALTAIGLCARALIKIGATAIADFEDGSAEAEVASALYATTRDALLSAYPWNFAQAQAALARLDDSPAADYAYAFQLPSDYLRAMAAGQSGRGRGIDYRIVGRTLQADCENVVLTYVRRPDEVDFPAFFDIALLARLAAEFCIPLTENASRADVLAKLAESELRRARQIDGQQDPTVGFEDFSLIAVRG